MNAHRPKITASQSPAGNLAGTVKSMSPAVPATFLSAPFDTECQADLTPLDAWATDGGAVAADDGRHTLSAVGGQSERGSANTDADAGLPPAASPCAECEGTGFFVSGEFHPDDPRSSATWDCDNCGGTGEVDEPTWEEFAAPFRRLAEGWARVEL